MRAGDCVPSVGFNRRRVGTMPSVYDSPPVEPSSSGSSSLSSRSLLVGEPMENSRLDGSSQIVRAVIGVANCCCVRCTWLASDPRSVGAMLASNDDVVNVTFCGAVVAGTTASSCAGPVPGDTSFTSGVDSEMGRAPSVRLAAVGAQGPSSAVSSEEQAVMPPAITRAAAVTPKARRTDFGVYAIAEDGRCTKTDALLTKATVVGPFARQRGPRAGRVRRWRPQRGQLTI